MLIRPDLDFCGESLQFSLQLNLHKWLTLSQVFMFVLVLCVNYLVVVSQLREINKMLELYFPLGLPSFWGFMLQQEKYAIYVVTTNRSNGIALRTPPKKCSYMSSWHSLKIL